MANKILVAVAGMMAAASLVSPVSAQNSGQDTFSQFLGAILGQVNSMDAQWQRGQRPLAAGRAQFSSRLDADVRAGNLSAIAADRMRADYDALVATETQYAADGVFSAQERSDLRTRYDGLTQTYSEGGPAVGRGPSAAAGQAAFQARVDAAVNAGRITRAQATQLRADYASVVQLENTYSRGGFSAQEQSDIDNRLDALDRRLPPLPPPPVQLTLRARLDQAQTTLRNSQRTGAITTSQAAELRTQLGDLTRLEAAYARAAPSADDNAYLERRVGEIEARLRARTARGR